MAAGGGAPPTEAVRGARGVSAVLAVIVAIVTFAAGLGAGWLVFGQAPAAKQVLLLGTNTPFPPFESNVGGSIIGFDADLIQEMVTRGGYAYEWRDYRDFTALLAATAAQGVDIAIGAITMNGDTGTARNATLHFTNPYFLSNQGVLKRTGDATVYCAAANCLDSELNKTGLKIGVQELTTSFYWVDSNAKDATVTVKPSVADLLLALDQSNIDIIVIDKPAADGLSAANPTKYAVAGTIPTNELYGFAVPRTASDDAKHAFYENLVTILNAKLADIKSDGTYAKLIDKWF